MSNVNYKGYVIRATPKQLRDSGEWNMDLMISKDHGYSRAERQFSAGNTFKTEEEAVTHCITFGKNIIDGKSSTCTVEDL